MSLGNVTKIVAVCIFVAVAACSKKGPRTVDAEAGGARSKVGENLRKQSWCTDTRTDDKGNIYQDEFRFNLSGELRVTRLGLQGDGTLKPVMLDIGSWSLMGDKLMLLQEKQSAQFALSNVTRKSDDEECLQMTNDNLTETLCGCSP